MQDYRAIVDRLKGPLVPVFPAFAQDERLDLDSTCRFVNWIVESGIPMMWLTAGASRYNALSDRELWDLTKAVAEVTRGRCILIAGTNLHWPAHQCREYLQHAAECGADIVKLQTSWPELPNPHGVINHYKAIAADSPLPLFAYTLGPGINGAMFDQILEMPQFVGMKNDSGDFYEQRAYLWAVRRSGEKFAVMTGGSMMSFLFGYDFGAQAFASGYGVIAPHIPLMFYRNMISGNREKAVEMVRSYEEEMLAEFAPIGGWLALRGGLELKGLFSSRQPRFPMPVLGDKAMAVLKNHLEAKGFLP